MKPAEHPAKFSDEILDAIAEIVLREIPSLSGVKLPHILDVFGGVGKIGLLKDRGVPGWIYSNEIEEEWAVQGLDYGCDEIRVGDARLLPWDWSNRFNFVITSCVYGNRMSDNHNARDKSKRLTYKHRLGRNLTTGNAGAMYFRETGKKGRDYRVLHQIAWREAWRVTNKYLILNTKDFYNEGELHEVGAWHLRTLEENGFILAGHVAVNTPGMGYGQNRELRVGHENVYVFEKRH